MSQVGQVRNTDTFIETLTGDSGGPVSPDGAGNINIFGGDTVTVVGNPGTSTLTIDATESGYPITPYVVGPLGQAGYQTIQSAIDAATLAGGTNMIWVQPGTYTEDLNITSSISLASIDGIATIVGEHTPPTTGTLDIEGLVLVSSPNILNSAAAGSTVIQMNNCFHVVADGYVFNLPNWTGEILADNCGEASTQDGFINNVSGSATVKLINVEMGAGSTRTMELNCAGTFLRFDTCNVNCPVNLAGSGTIFMQNGVKFANTVTIGGSLSGFAIDTNFRGGSSQAIVFNSTGDFSLSNGEVQSTNNPAIGGTGSGTISLTSVSFPDNDDIAGTLTVASGTTYSGTLKTDYTDHGVLLGQGSVSNVVATSAGTDGQVLIGATGADPAFATITSTGGTITFTPGANSLNMESGATVPTQFDTDSGSATPAANILEVLGGTLINTAGATNVVTINADDAVAASFPTDSGTATPSGNALTISGADGITTSGTGSTVTVTGSGASIHTWVDVTGTSDNMEAGKGYMANNGAQVTLTLPSTAAQGTVIRVAGVGAGGWVIDQGTGQSINYLGSTTTTTTGTLAGDEVNACIELLCTVADTTWLALSSVGNFTLT